MLRMLLFLFAIVFVVSLSARAQGIEVFGGYSFERYSGAPARQLNGWEVAGQFKIAGIFGVVGDLDAHYGASSKVDNRSVIFMVGPQLSFPAHISPFVHVLAGVGHIHAGGNTGTSIATAIGGGVDVHLLPILSWRAVQVDDVITHFFGATQNNPRISTGLVVRF